MQGSRVQGLTNSGPVAWNRTRVCFLGARGVAAVGQAQAAVHEEDEPGDVQEEVLTSITAGDSDECRKVCVGTNLCESVREL